MFQQKFSVSFTRCLVNLYKLDVFKDSVKEPLNVQISNLLKVGDVRTLRGFLTE